MKPLKLGLLLVALGALVACRSHVVDVTLVNTSTLPVTIIIVDYPGGTFGKNSLEPGKPYSYKIKPLQDGPLKIQFTDGAGAIHSSLWPSLRRNQEGNIEIRFSQDSATIVPALKQ